MARISDEELGWPDLKPAPLPPMQPRTAEEVAVSAAETLEAARKIEADDGIDF